MEVQLYTQQPTRTKATGKIPEPTKLSETWELKKKNERNKERKEERKKNSKTNLMLSLAIGAFLEGHSSVEK